MSRRSTSPCPDFDDLVDWVARTDAAGPAGDVRPEGAPEEEDDSDIQEADRAGDAMVRGWAAGLLSAGGAVG
jgi:hypothetical protein